MPALRILKPFIILRRMRLRLPTRSLEFPRRPLVMGIINVNDDSFSGDGSLAADDAVDTARTQIVAGADVIDIGAESARTNRQAVPEIEEIDRFQCVITRWGEIVANTTPRDADQVWPPILSANTWRPGVVKAVLEMGGVEIINDMSALPDAKNARLCADHGAALLIMHSVGEPKVPHFHQQWPDVMAELERFFHDKIKLATDAGLAAESIILDPGIDFAKQRDDNLTIYQNLTRLSAFGRPLLVPVSRKTVIGEVLGIPDPRDRDAGTIACIASAMARGGDIFRVHNVEAAWQAVRTLAVLNTC
jgi:dihydropteroate synthase